MAGRSQLTAHKSEVVKKYARNATDTGSSEVQIALLTDRINRFNGHAQKNPQDFHSKRGLILMVSKRKKLLRYLRETEPTRYNKLIKELELRK